VFVRRYLLATLSIGVLIYQSRVNHNPGGVTEVSTDLDDAIERLFQKNRTGVGIQAARWGTSEFRRGSLQLELLTAVISKQLITKN